MSQKKRRRPVHLHVMVSEEELALIRERMAEAGVRNLGAYRDDQKQGERTMSAIQEQSFEWLLCPVCKSKTRLKIRKDTILDNFPLFCPKCKSEMLICVKQFHISIIKEPDAQTQSR